MELATTDQTTRMDRLKKPALAAAVFLFVAAAMLKAMAGPSLASLTGVTPEVVAQLVTPLIAEAVPREFEGKKDWGKTAKVTTGLRSEGNCENNERDYGDYFIHRTSRWLLDVQLFQM